ncbi:MAG: NADH-quinone oxidoreductase subunit NuoH [Peptococcaceae bacterium]|jgi:NADH-quinone oxidoreductase subunit H|nr:NADH-quinone oxidoreductase subunit NuoH [Peptococcaceae bacterium]
MGDRIFIEFGNYLSGLLALAGAPLLLNQVILMIVKIVGALLFILLNLMFIIWLERRLAGWFQARVGPNRVGPKGLLQALADVGKLISKEIIIPGAVDKVIFLLAPVLIFVPSLVLFAVVPFGRGMIPVDLNLGIFFFFAIGSLSIVVFFMGGWASANKYSLIGSMRAVAQMVSYEIPMVLSVLGVVMITGSLKMSSVIASQTQVWNIFTQPVAFLIYFAASVAEVNRTPFDVVEGESEIVAGPMTEYGGMAFAMWYMAEYTNVILVSAFAVTLFLGGWLAPFGWTFLPSWVWFVLKLYLLIFLHMWVRWTYPRIRVDQLMSFGWKVLVPLSLANVFVTGFGMYVFRGIGW